MEDLRPIMKERLKALSGKFDNVVEFSHWAVTLDHGGPLGAAWFFKNPNGTAVAVALSTTRLVDLIYRDRLVAKTFIPLCKTAIECSREYLGYTRLISHVHNSFPSSAKWMERMGFRAVGWREDLMEYCYEPETTA